MANIPLLEVGCTGQQVIDTINAIIARLNEGSGQTISYKDLSDKPTINGVELDGNKSTPELSIAIKETTDYNTLIDTLATKSYANEAKNEAVAAAETAVRTALESKLEKDLSNITAASTLSDDGYILVVTEGDVKKVKMELVSAYAEQKNTVNQQNTTGNAQPAAAAAGGSSSTEETFMVSLEPEDWQENDIWGHVAVVRDDRANGVRSAFSTPGTETLSTWSESPACLVAVEDGALVYASPKACPTGTLVMNVFCEK